MLLKHGMQGPDVTALQETLGKLSYLRVAPTGFFGDATKLAVIGFQKDNALSADGVVGEKTLTALFSHAPKESQAIERPISDRELFTRDDIIADKTGIEAGWVNNPDDLGGETNHGVTKHVAKKHEAALHRIFGWNGDMRDLTKEMARWIYIVDYWDALSLDDVLAIDPCVADKVFDIGINAGISRAGEWLQSMICVTNKKGTLYPDVSIDGAVGGKTLKGLESCFRAHGSKTAGWTIVKGLLSLQGAHYINICLAREANETFYMGWSNRLDHNKKLYQDYYGFV